MPRYVIDVSKTCPNCGAPPILAGELTMERKNMDGKWFGPFMEFACGMAIVMPANRIVEVWNKCSQPPPNPPGRYVDIPKSDYEMREGRPTPEPEYNFDIGIVHRLYAEAFDTLYPGESNARSYKSQTTEIPGWTGTEVDDDPAQGSAGESVQPAEALRSGKAERTGRKHRRSKRRNS